MKLNAGTLKQKQIKSMQTVGSPFLVAARRTPTIHRIPMPLRRPRNVTHASMQIIGTETFSRFPCTAAHTSFARQSIYFRRVANWLKNLPYITCVANTNVLLLCHLFNACSQKPLVIPDLKKFDRADSGCHSCWLWP